MQLGEKVWLPRKREERPFFPGKGRSFVKKIVPAGQETIINVYNLLQTISRILSIFSLYSFLQFCILL